MPRPMRSYVDATTINVAGRVRSERRPPSLGFGTTGQPETYVISPTGVAVCGALGPATQAELDIWLQAARDGQECT